MTAVVGEMSQADIKRLANRETILDDFLKVVKGRVKSMNNNELTSLCQNVFDNSELKTFSFRTGLWPSISTQISANIKSLTYSQLSQLNVILAHLNMNHILVRQAQFIIEEELQARPFSQDLVEFGNVLWAASFPGIETPLLRRIVRHLTEEIDLSQVSIGTLSKFQSFLKRSLTDISEIERFYEKTITAKLTEPCSTLDLIEALVYAIPYSLGSHALRNQLENALVHNVQTSHTALESVHLTRLLQTYLYTKTTDTRILDFILSEVNRCAADFSVKELLDAAIVCSRVAGSSETLSKLTKLFVAAMKEVDETVISQTGCLAMIRAIYVSGLQMQEFLYSIVNYVENLFEKTPPNIGIAVRMISMLSHMRYFKPSLKSLFYKHMWQVRSSARFNPSDLSNVLTVITESADVSSHELLQLLENLVFFMSSHFPWWNMVRAAYSFSRVNRGTPELYQLLKKRILDEDVNVFTDFHNLALGLFAYTQINHTDYIEHLFPVVKTAIKEIGEEVDISETIMRQQPRFNPAYRPFLHTKMKVPAVSVVQVCWSLAVSKLADDLWTDSILSHLESLDYSSAVTFSTATWHRIAMLLQQNVVYTSKVDLFHYHLLINTLALVYSTRMSKSDAIAKVREKLAKAPTAVIKNLEKYRFPVNPEFKADVMDRISSGCRKAVLETHDQLYNKIDALINNKVAILLTDQEDYVYLTEGYKQIEGTSDLFASLKTKAEVLTMQGLVVEIVARGQWQKLTKVQKTELIRTKTKI